jgi:hypothetical protein
VEKPAQARQHGRLVNAPRAGLRNFEDVLEAADGG